MKKVMRIGTRKSALAIAQTKMFIEACQRIDSAIQYEIVEMSTKGDQILDKPLYAFNGKGMFVSVFEQALISGEIDMAVHSGKDMPAEIPGGLQIAAVLKRGDPRDVLVTLADEVLPADAVIGTGSLRRKAQVKEVFGYKAKDIRGNVNTRLRRLRDGEVDGLILAAAGLERLGLFSSNAEFEAEDARFSIKALDERIFLPAAAQGIIVIESRKDNCFSELLSHINDKETMLCLLAERGFLKEMDAGCQQPIAAYSYCKDGRIYMDAAVWKNGGKIYRCAQDCCENAEMMAVKLAMRIKA